MTRRPEPIDIIGTAVDPFAGLPLAAQREASPEVSRVPTATMPGHGTRARQLAREKAAPTMPAARARVLRIVTAHGPMSRNAIAEHLAGTSPAPATVCNGVNGRVRELIISEHLHITGLDADGRGLVAIRPPTSED